MNLATDIRHEQIREMQCRLLREEFWSADTRKGLRTKIEQSDGQISHYGPAIVMVFRGLAQSKQTEEELEVIDKSSFYTGESSFYTERDETNRNVILTYQTITTAPDLRNTSQEVCVSQTPPPDLLRIQPFPGTPPGALSTEFKDSQR